MFLNVKKLTGKEKELCLKTVSSKAIFAIVSSAIVEQASLSIVRMGDGEGKILASDDTVPFAGFETASPGWNKRYGVEDIPAATLKEKVLEAGNSCTYFAPSISGISLPNYNLYDYFKPREYYFDNFFVNDWTYEMIKMLLETSDGIFIIHRDYQEIIHNFQANYDPDKLKLRFDGFSKNSWLDNEQAVEAAIKSDMQLVLFGSGPAGKVIGPQIAQAKNKIVLDVGNTLKTWSLLNQKES